MQVQGVVHKPEAMMLCTASTAGFPSTCVVLFKQPDLRGFVFYTKYTSRKSQELRTNTHAVLAFHWREVHKQVCVVGRVKQVMRAESKHVLPQPSHQQPAQRVGEQTEQNLYQDPASLITCYSSVVAVASLFVNE